MALGQRPDGVAEAKRLRAPSWRAASSDLQRVRFEASLTAANRWSSGGS